jgi:hypothetical protein
MICAVKDCRVRLGITNRSGFCRQHQGQAHKRQPVQREGVQREGVRYVTVNRVSPCSSADTQLTTMVSLPKEPWPIDDESKEQSG